MNRKVWGELAPLCAPGLLGRAYAVPVVEGRIAVAKQKGPTGGGNGEGGSRNRSKIERAIARVTLFTEVGLDEIEPGYDFEELGIHASGAPGSPGMRIFAFLGGGFRLCGGVLDHGARPCFICTHLHSGPGWGRVRAQIAAESAAILGLYAAVPVACAVR